MASHSLLGFCALLLSYSTIITGHSDDGTVNTAYFAERLELLERHIKHQDGKIATLERQVFTQKHQLKEATRILAQSGKNLSSYSQTETKQHTLLNLERGRRAPVPKVAFSAYLDHEAHHVGINGVIPFNQVILNDGGAFSPITGIFTVPASGVYLFTYTVNTFFKSYQLVVKLVLDGANMSDGISDPFHDAQEVQGGNTVMFRANKQQSVWLAAYNTGDVTVDGRETHRFTTFSGYLLYE